MMGTTSPYRQALLPVMPKVHWRRLAACFVLLVVLTSAAALLALGSVATIGSEWNDSWKLDSALGLMGGVVLLVTLLAAMLPYSLWINRERGYLHSGLLRNVAWSWRVATGLTVAAVVTFALVQSHPAPDPPSGDGGAAFSFGGC